MRKIILCVDDEIFLLKSLKDEIISTFGYEFEVVVTDSPFEALQLIEKFKSESREIVITIADHIMPGMKGDELLKKIYALSPLTVNIMLSGQVSVEGVINSINNAQLFKYLEKPWKRKTLKKVILEALSTYGQNVNLDIENAKLREKVVVLKNKLNSVNKTSDEGETSLF